MGSTCSVIVKSNPTISLLIVPVLLEPSCSKGKSDDMKLMKYTSSNGTIHYIIKNIEGETVAKDLNQNQLASRYPEMAEKLEG